MTIAFVSGATTTLARYAHTGLFGRLIVPDAGNRVDAEPLLPWAGDNGAFAPRGFDPEAFERMLARCKPFADSCKFVACPDEVGDAERTALLYEEWAPFVIGHGFPCAFVAQDGIEGVGVPWGACDAVFIGGSDQFKLGRVAEDLLREARERGKWTHVGRVNSQRRVRRFQSLGTVDSIDGTILSRWPDTYFPRFVNQLGNPQLGLLEAAE